jgi:hypothetical protein
MFWKIPFWRISVGQVKNPPHGFMGSWASWIFQNKILQKIISAGKYTTENEFSKRFQLGKWNLSEWNLAQKILFVRLVEMHFLKDNFWKIPFWKIPVLWKMLILKDSMLKYSILKHLILKHSAPPAILRHQLRMKHRAPVDKKLGFTGIWERALDQMRRGKNWGEDLTTRGVHGACIQLEVTDVILDLEYIKMTNKSADVLLGTKRCKTS